MIFAYPYAAFFLFVPVGVGIFLIFRARKNRRDLEKFASSELLPKLVDMSTEIFRTRRWIIRIAVLTLLGVALMGPKWGYQWQDLQQSSLEILFAVDTSKSMLAQDIEPNRLERAKLAVKDFLGMAAGDKVGLVAFAGESFLQCPLTMDYDAFATILDSLSVNTIPQGGTAIGEAIGTATKAFQAGSAGDKVLIIITDGENHEGDPVALAKKAAAKGITVYTVGIGSAAGDLILVDDGHGNKSYLKDEHGNVVKSALNEGMLKAVAAAGHGIYLHGTGPSLGLDQLYRARFAVQSKQSSKHRLQKAMVNRYQLPLLLALVLLCMEIRLPEQWGFKPKCSAKKTI